MGQGNSTPEYEMRVRVLSEVAELLPLLGGTRDRNLPAIFSDAKQKAILGGSDSNTVGAIAFSKSA
jgi:hypothetical protein